MRGQVEIEPGLEAAGTALARATGVSLADGLRVTLREAVRAAGEALGIPPEEVARRAGAGEADVLDVLAEHAVVCETFFWRHPEGLVVLAARLAEREAPIRIWSAGCATGEEPYSLAMALLDAGREGRGDRILATDLSARALAEARAARYDARSLRRLPEDLVARWFRPVEGAQALRTPEPALREMVELRRHNLVAEPPPGTFDAVVCRNVLIYFTPIVAEAALERLAEAVAPGGYLLLGPVELALAGRLPFRWIEQGGATLLRRTG